MILSRAFLVNIEKDDKKILDELRKQGYARSFMVRVAIKHFINHYKRHGLASVMYEERK